MHDVREVPCSASFLRFTFWFLRRRIPRRFARIAEALVLRSLCFRSPTASPAFGVVLFSFCGCLVAHLFPAGFSSAADS